MTNLCSYCGISDAVTPIDRHHIAGRLNHTRTINACRINCHLIETARQYAENTPGATNRRGGVKKAYANQASPDQAKVQVALGLVAAVELIGTVNGADTPLISGVKSFVREIRGPMRRMYGDRVLPELKITHPLKAPRMLTRNYFNCVSVLCELMVFAIREFEDLSDFDELADCLESIARDPGCLARMETALPEFDEDVRQIYEDLLYRVGRLSSGQGSLQELQSMADVQKPLIKLLRNVTRTRALVS